jgi:hypothetical protein
MKQLCIIALLVTVSCFAQAQQVVTVDLKKHFGAKGDGKTNDHKAFRRATRFIMARGGFTQLVIPNGTYIVGHPLEKPLRIRNNYWYDENFDIPDSIDLMRLKNCRQITIKGGTRTCIKVQDGMKFGCFDPLTGAVPHAGSPRPTVSHPDLAKGFELMGPPQGYRLVCPPYTVVRNGRRITLRDTLRNHFANVPPSELYRHIYNRYAYTFQGYYRFNNGNQVDSVNYLFFPTLEFPGNQTVEITPGTLFSFVNCSQLRFENLYVDGNSDRHRLGGSKNSSHPTGYEVHAYGFELEDVQQVVFLNVHQTSCGTLGMHLRNTNSVFKHQPQQVSFTNCSFTRNGWGNLYISGGKGISIRNCRLDSAGFASLGRIATAPCTGLAFEDETNEGVQDVTVDNVLARWNHGAGFNNCYEKDSNFVVRNSSFHSLDYYNLIAAKSSYFYNCNFYSPVNYLNSAADNRVRVVFKNCLFTDSMDRKTPRWKEMKFLFCGGHIASPLLIDSCRFENHYSYFDYLPSSAPGMITVSNSTFNQYHAGMQFGYIYFNGAKFVNNRYNIPRSAKNGAFINEARAKFPQAIIKERPIKE